MHMYMECWKHGLHSVTLRLWMPSPHSWKFEKTLRQELTSHDAEIWQTEVNIGLMVRNLPKSCIILFQLLVHVTQVLEQLLFGVRVAPTFWCDKRGHTAVKSNFPTLERGPSQEHMNAALYLGYMASHGYHSISRVYREIYDVYLNILKSPQEHFINARM